MTVAPACSNSAGNAAPAPAMAMVFSSSRRVIESSIRAPGLTIVVAFGLTPSFSADDKWVAYPITVSAKERERLTKEKKPVHNSLEARNLATGQVVDVPDVSESSFSPNGRFLAISRYPAEGKKI